MSEETMQVRITRRQRRFDRRGWLLKVADASDDHGGPPGFSEAYLVQAGVASTRGNHYHRNCFEWFTPIRGSGCLVLENPATGQRRTIPLSGDTPVTVEVPPGIAHAVQADSSEELWVLALTSLPYDPDDVVAYPVAEDPEPGTAR